MAGYARDGAVGLLAVEGAQTKKMKKKKSRQRTKKKQSNTKRKKKKKKKKNHTKEKKRKQNKTAGKGGERVSPKGAMGGKNKANWTGGSG